MKTLLFFYIKKWPRLWEYEPGVKPEPIARVNFLVGYRLTAFDSKRCYYLLIRFFGKSHPQNQIIFQKDFIKFLSY